MQEKPPVKTDSSTFVLNTVDEAVADIRAGKMVIVVDDEDRENEGDFVAAAEHVTPEMINFMAKHGRGLICTPMEETRADRLDLPLMVHTNTALHETAFTVSVDLIGHGCTTGISAYDRATCIKALADDSFGPQDFSRPGHIFPLRAKAGGVLRRPGHTEATVDLVRLAGLTPVGVLVEILNEDGSMARLPQLVEIARRFDLKIISIKDLVAYRLRHESLVERLQSWQLDSSFGKLHITAFRQVTTGDIHFAIRLGTWTAEEAVPVRVHSAPRPDELLTSLFDRRHKRFFKAMEIIAREGKGLLVYMRHQDKGSDLFDWLDKHAGGMGDQAKPRRMDSKDFGVGAQIIREMGVSKLKLIAGTRRNWVALEGYSLTIESHIDFMG